MAGLTAGIRLFGVLSTCLAYGRSIEKFNHVKSRVRGCQELGVLKVGVLELGKCGISEAGVGHVQAQHDLELSPSNQSHSIIKLSDQYYKEIDGTNGIIGSQHTLSHEQS